VSVRILTGDCRNVLKTLPDESVHCVVTSPPYWGLRDYGTGQAGIGLEETMADHLSACVEAFREVRRVLRSDGTLWLNYGDAYAGSWGAQGRGDKRSEMEIGGRIAGDKRKSLSETQIIAHPKRRQTGSRERHGLKAKDLMGLPWRIAFALQDDGWWLRSDIIWAKPNPMPESVTDRPTRAHEYIFLMTKSARYWYDADAVKERAAESSIARWAQDVEAQDGSDRANGGAKTNGPMKAVGGPRSIKMDGSQDRRKQGFNQRWDAKERIGAKGNAKGFRGGSYVGGEPGPRTEVGNEPSPDASRNIRTVWEIGTEPFKEAHFATFPTRLAETCIKAGCPAGGVVLDPFGGAGTVGLVADRLQRNAILIELNPEYAAMAERRIRGDAPMFAEVSA